MLSATLPPPLPPDTPAAVRQELPAFTRLFQAGHGRLAALSSAGVHRLVPDTHHDVQQEQPAAVLDAIRDVVTAVRQPPAAGR